MSQILWDKSAMWVQGELGGKLLAKVGLEIDVYDRSSFTEKRADFTDRQERVRSGTTMLASVPENAPSHCWGERLAAQPR